MICENEAAAATAPTTGALWRKAIFAADVCDARNETRATAREYRVAPFVSLYLVQTLVFWNRSVVQDLYYKTESNSKDSTKRAMELEE